MSKKNTISNRWISFMNNFTLNRLKRLNSHNPNPLYAWKAYKHSREFGMPIPGWVLNYLDDSATKLLAIEQPEKNKVARAISDAIGMKKQGRGTVFANYRKIERDLKIAVRVSELIEKEKEERGSCKETAIYDEVAKELDCDRSTVIRAVDFCNR